MPTISSYIFVKKDKRKGINLIYEYEIRLNLTFVHSVVSVVLIYLLSMKKLIVATSILVSASFLFLAFDISDKNGKAGYTGAPGESTTCSNCHGGGSASASGIMLSSVPAFSNGTGYYADSVYQITISMYATGFTKYGFDAQFLNSSNTQAGTLKSAGSGVKFTTLGSRRHAIHSAVMSASSGTAAFTFTWQAPSTGNATLYAIGNAVNGDNSFNGDYVIAPVNFPLEALELPQDPIDVGLTTQQIDATNLNFFPNPTQGNLNISFMLTQPANTQVALYGIDGRWIKNLYQGTGEVGINSLALKLDVPAGLYFVKVTSNNQQQRSKLITVL